MIIKIKDRLINFSRVNEVYLGKKHIKFWYSFEDCYDFYFESEEETLDVITEILTSYENEERICYI